MLLWLSLGGAAGGTSNNSNIIELATDGTNVYWYNSWAGYVGLANIASVNTAIQNNTTPTDDPYYINTGNSGNNNPYGIATSLTPKYLYWVSTTGGTIGRDESITTTPNLDVPVMTLSGINGAALFEDANDNISAFSVQNASDTDTLFNVDTKDTAVDVDASLIDQGGLTITGFGTTGSGGAPSSVSASYNSGGGSSTYQYEYAVSAVNYSNYSASACATGGMPTYATTATGVAYSDTTDWNTGTDTTITWSNVPGASGYCIYRVASTKGFVVNSPTYGNETGLIGYVSAATYSANPNANLPPFTWYDYGQSTSNTTTIIPPSVDSSGELDATGIDLFQNATNSASAFEIQASATSGGAFII